MNARAARRAGLPTGGSGEPSAESAEQRGFTSPARARERTACERCRYCPRHQLQHCQAILTALDVAADDAVLGIRVEGTVDALDLEVIAEGPSGAGPLVVRGLQMKSRQQPHTWARAELLAIVHRWAELPVSADSESHSLPTASSGRPGTQSLLRWTRLE